VAAHRTPAEVKVSSVCGKTRLALRLAGTLTARFPGGIWWIDLAPLTGPEAVTGAVARAVPLVPVGAGLDTMAEVLGQVEALLVLTTAST
jgi:predicted ATPase